MPRVDYATYEVKKDKVIATLSKQNASAFTKLAKEHKLLAADLELMNAKKRELNELQNSIKDREAHISNSLKEKIPALFNDSEKLLTLSVECLGSSFTLSKFAESNQDKVITKAGDIISTDYKAILDQLLIQTPELAEAVKLLTTQFSVLAESDVIKKGAERRLSVNVESIVQESIWDKVKDIINKLTRKFKSLFTGLQSRQNKINSMLNKLNESADRGKIMLNKTEKQLVKEYANKLISKRKLNENSKTDVLLNKVVKLLSSLGYEKDDGGEIQFIYDELEASDLNGGENLDPDFDAIDRFCENFDYIEIYKKDKSIYFDRGSLPSVDVTSLIKGGVKRIDFVDDGSVGFFLK